MRCCFNPNYYTAYRKHRDSSFLIVCSRLLQCYAIVVVVSLLHSSIVVCSLAPRCSELLIHVGGARDYACAVGAGPKNEGHVRTSPAEVMRFPLSGKLLALVLSRGVPNAKTKSSQSSHHRTPPWRPSWRPCAAAGYCHLRLLLPEPQQQQRIINRCWERCEDSRANGCVTCALIRFLGFWCWLAGLTD